MNVKILLVIFFFLLFIYLRPIYSIIILMLFSSEHIYFMNYLLKYLKYKKKNNYKSFKITEINTDKLSLYEIWDKTNEIRAFKKIYTLVIKNKKISFKSILKTILVIIGDIPLKVINISKFMLYGKGNLRASLIELYYVSYWEIKDLKIEIINKEVYTNCSTRNDILKKIMKINPNANEKEICRIYKQLVNLSEKYQEDLNKYRDLKKPIKFKLGILKTEEGVNIKKAHYSSELNTNFDYKGRNHLKAIIHATSNVPNILTDTQFSTIAMKNLRKENSLKCGTIITCGNYEFEQKIDSSLYIPQWQVYRVTYEVKLNPNVEFRDLFYEWDSKFSKVLNADFRKKDHLEIIKSFGNGYDDFALQADKDSSNEDIMKSIKEINVP